MIYDCHAHLDIVDKKYLPFLIENAKKSNVKIIITQSTNKKSLKDNLKLHKKYPDIVKLSAGLYPEKNINKKDLIYLIKFINLNKKFIFSIGEVGMDFSEENPDKKIQEYLFRKQLSLAQKLNIPVSIHTRKAEKEIISILKEYPKVKKILHCFCGKLKLAKEAEKIGCYFSIPTNIVRSEHFQKLVLLISKDKILTETDTPYLSPFQNKQNEPAFIKETIKQISLLWKISQNKVENQIEENFKRIYN